MEEKEAELGILDTVKDVVTLVQKADNLELVKQILTLQSDIMKMMDENRTLKDEIRALKEQLHIKQKLIFRQDDYWMPVVDGPDEGPFCSVCQNVDGKLVRMSKRGMGSGHFCQACLIEVPHR